jgi:hypothetical protein
LTFPGVDEGTSYGTPALKVRKKLLCRMKEDGETLVLPVSSLDEKELLMAQQPEIFFETPHYAGWPAVLVRLARIGDDQLGRMLEEGWRRSAGKRLLALRDAQSTASSTAPKQAAAKQPARPAKRGVERRKRPSRT